MKQIECSEQKCNESLSVRKLFVSCFLLMLTLAACVTGSDSLRGNAQVLADPNGLYPNADFVIAVGTGSSRSQAENTAIANLAQIFEAEIVVDSSAQQSYNSAFADLAEGAVRSEISQSVDISSEHKLINVRYSEHYLDRSATYHVIAYIDREETGEIYRELIAENEERVGAAVAAVSEISGLIRSLSLVGEALGLAQVNEVLLSQLQIINAGFARLARPELSLAEIEEAYRSLASRLVFRVSVDGADASLVQHISEELAQLGYASSEEGALSVSGNISLREGGASERYVTVLWSLQIDIVDSDGTVIGAIQETNRERALDLVTAEFLALETIKQVLSDSMVEILNRVLPTL